jgi:hypothetical protein
VRILVLGGGPVGQLFKWAVPSSEVFEALPAPTNSTTRSWGANYLWKPIPGIECRQFPVITHIDGEIALNSSIRAYKAKVGKADESNLDWNAQFQFESIGYEMVRPPEVEVNWACRVDRIDIRRQTVQFSQRSVIEYYDVLISTLPIYTLLTLCGFPRDSEPWRFNPIYVRVIQRPPDARYPIDHMYVNYISDPNESVYRVTDRDGQRHFEDLKPTQWDAKKLAPGKIHPHSSTDRYRALLSSYNIFTFGRYGTWNTSELLHQTWDEIVKWRENFIPDFVG